MGYEAKCSGTITLDIKPDKYIEDIISEILEWDGVTDGVQDGTYDISVWLSDRYDNETTKEQLNKLLPHVVEGRIDYIGDDDAIWCWYFNKGTGEWDTDSGDIVFWDFVTLDEIPSSALERLMAEYKRRNDIEDVMSIGIEGLIGYDELPPMEEETKRAIAEKAVEDYRHELDGNDHISEIIQQTAEEAVKPYIPECMPVVGAYGLNNNGSVNVYYMDSEHVFAGVNNFAPEWCDLYEREGENGLDFFFKLGELEIPVDQVLAIGRT